MGFEVVNPRAFKLVRGPTDNRAILFKRGDLLLSPEVLAKAGIDGSAVVLVDKGTAQLALRSPKENEGGVTIRCRATKGAEKLQAVNFNIGFALRRYGWGTGKLARFHGPKPVVIRDGEEKLVVVLLEGTGAK